MTPKEIVLHALEALPDDADIGEIIEQILFLNTLQRRLERADHEPTFSHEEVKRQMAERQG